MDSTKLPTDSLGFDGLSEPCVDSLCIFMFFLEDILASNVSLSIANEHSTDCECDSFD